ncbi:MAG: TonB-dependent receptor [Pseudomonadota bacterium]
MVGKQGRTLLAILATALVVPGVSLSQDIGDDRPIIMQELIVQGELQERSLQDSPTSVVIIPGDELDRRDDFDLYDIIERTPNVTSTAAEKGFSIRGIGQRGPTSAGSGLAITTNIDGASLPSVLSVIFGPYSTWDLEQVEILRGPQSTQQGRNALAGAVVIRSADPTYDKELKARGEIGSRDTLGGAIAVNLPLIEERAALRLSAERVRTDGFVFNPTIGTENFDARRQTTLRAKLRLDPTDDLSAVALVSYAENFGGEDFIEQELRPEDRFNLSDVRGEEGSDHVTVGLRLGYDYSDAIRIESESTYYRNVYVRVEDADLSARDEGFFDLEDRAKSFAQELRVKYESDRWRGVVGGYFTRIEAENDSLSRLTDDFFSDIIPPGTELIFPPILDLEVEARTRGATTTTNYAFFGEVEYRILPELGLIAGARFDRERQETTSEDETQININLPPELFAPPNQDPLDLEARFSAFLPKAGVVYDWTDNLSTSFVVQRGYRAGGAQINAFTREVNEFEPEFTWNYELALRSTWLDGRLTANANAFFLSWRDQQVTVDGDSGSSLDVNTINAGSSRLFGGELSLQTQPLDNLSVFGSVGVTKTRFLELVDAGQDFSGNQFAQAPLISAALGASYFFDNGFELHTDASYTGPAFGDAENTEEGRVDGRFLLNVRAGYQAEHWGAFVYARNLLDQDYVLARTFRGATRVRVGEPLTVGAYAAVNF